MLERIARLTVKYWRHFFRSLFDLSWHPLEQSSDRQTPLNCAVLSQLWLSECAERLTYNRRQPVGIILSMSIRLSSRDQFSFRRPALARRTVVAQFLVLHPTVQ
jgi:hypothetical protein